MVLSTQIFFASAGAFLTRFPSMSDQQQTTILPNDSESFRTIPNPAEGFGNIPNDTESFRTIRNVSERKENHTLTVREAARMFESAGVGRTERSIINWCQPNKTGVARLDCYFDPNDRKYYITPESVELAIAEEKAKYARFGSPDRSELSRDIGAGKAWKEAPRPADGHREDIEELNKQIFDLKIANRAKDHFIEQLKTEREAFNDERKKYVDQLITVNRQVGQLETKLLQVRANEAPSDPVA